MPLLSISNLQKNDNFLIDLGENIWLMDDHRWALLVWEMKRKHNRYTLVHADQHWDACYDFHENKEEEGKLLVADTARIHEYLIEDNFIRFDSFIAPAVRRGLFDVVHFFCTEDNENDIGLYDVFLKECGASQVIHPSVDSLAAVKFKNPVIFDLCLDLFNRSDMMMKGDLWSDSEIQNFLNSIKHIIG